MSAFSFINESRLIDNQASNKNALDNNSKRKQERPAYQQSGQLSNSLYIFKDTRDDPFYDQSSHSSEASSSNKHNDSWKKNFKSSFSFINQGDSAKPISPVAKHQPLKFSSSFIMEDFMDSDEDRASSISDKSAKKDNINKYLSLMEGQPSKFTDKKRNGSRKGKEKLIQSMLDHSVSSDRLVGQAPLFKSAFNFINRAPSTTDISNATSPSLPEEEKVFAMSKSIIKPDKEMALLQASTCWQKIQKKKLMQVQRIKKHYEDQIKYGKMVHEMKDEINSIDSKKRQALVSEDYEAAHKYAILGENMEKDYADLLSSNFQDQIGKEWEHLIQILQQEAQNAENMVKCCQEVKDERRRRFETFAADKERLHKETVKQMEKQRAAIESEKSEIAFDLDMWNQNHTDLDERMEEAVQSEVKRKKSLETKSTAIQRQLNIEELRQRLRQLESEQLTVNEELQDVEAIIENKLTVFKKEVDEDNNEKKTIEARQEEVQQKLNSLDEQDAKIERDLEDQKATRHLHEQELEHLLTQTGQADERVQSSKTEQSVLKDLLNSVIEKRGQTVSQHDAAIRRFRESIARKSREIKSIQDELYQCEQACVDLEENSTKVTIKLKSLDKLKKLAIENGQFERAGALSLKIKAAQSTLVKLEESKDHQNDISLVNNRLATAKNELATLEQDLITLKNEQTTNLGLILEQLRQQLNESLQDESLKNYDTFVTFAKCELQLINTPLSDY
ncbi:hypothetical protein MAM1_0114d05653 [Mucor ambiguus]|uniref:UVR domain-containing protein n=1 Tax=Mucor ambiguus TaxID=91626 RepID=A0A0C9MVP4_9FUNG|nr:hypothetical protein MAM1_0114d05653 [Mucor ambiguus]